MKILNDSTLLFLDPVKSIIDFSNVDLKRRVLWPQEALGLCFLNRNVQKSIKLPKALLQYISELIELNAFNVMRDGAATREFLEDGPKYFDLQYPSREAFYEETAMSCSEFLTRAQTGEFVLNFVTKEFISAWNYKDNVCAFFSGRINRLPANLKTKSLLKGKFGINGYLSNPISLDYFPRWLKDKVEMKELNFTHLTFKTLPNFVENYKGLVCLNLKNNELTELPSFVENLSVLEELDICFNKFKKLPEVLLKLKLKKLTIYMNPFEDKEADINRLKQMKTLEFVSLPASFEPFLNEGLNKTLVAYF